MAATGRSRPARPARSPGAWRRFITALVAVVVALVGVPALLVTCAAAALDRPHPLPRIGSSDEIRDYLDRGLTATEIVPIAVRVLLVVAWLLWTAMAVSIIGSIVEASTGNRRRWPHVRMFGGLSRWIAAGLTAVSSLSANFVSAGAMPSPLPFTISAVQPTGTIASNPADRVIPPGHARVLPGESAETFALRTLGDSTRWPEIWQLNQHRPVGPNGEAWTAAWKLSAGWDLRLPAGAAESAVSAVTADVDATPPAPPAGVDTPGPTTEPEFTVPDSEAAAPVAAADIEGGAEQYLVQVDDSYWTIAEARLGPGASGGAVAAYTEALMVHNAPRLGYAVPAMLQPGDMVSLVADADGASSTADADPASDRPTVPVEEAEHVYVSQPGDSYWRIAEQRAVQLHGEDGAHGNVVYELMLDLIDLNAPRLGYDDREMLHPGDEVWLFDPALDPAPGSVVATDGALVAPPVVEASTAIADTATATIEAAATIAAEPDATAPPPESAPPTSVEAPSSTEAPAAGAGADGSSADADRSPRRSSPSPIGLGEAGLIATGIIALLAARRRSRLRSAEPPARIPLPGASAAATERALRRVSAADRLLRIDIAVRAAAATMADTDSQIAALRSAPDGSIELVLTGPVTLPEPWSGSEARWMLDGAVAVDELAVAARTVGVPCVALTEIGVDDLGWDVLVDLEAIGLLAVDADAATADDVVRAVAAGLGSSEFAEVAHLVGVGVEAEAFLGHRQSHAVATLDEAIELATTLVGPTASAQRSTFALRSRRTGGEVWEPAVVVVGSAHAGELTAPMLHHATSRRGVALTVAGSVAGATWTLTPAGTTWLLDPLGIRIRPVGLDCAALDDLVDVLAVEPSAAVDFAPPAPPSCSPAEPAGGDSHAAVELLGAVGPDPAGHLLVVDLAAAMDDLAVSPIVLDGRDGDVRVSEPARLNGVALDAASNGHGPARHHGSGSGAATPPVPAATTEVTEVTAATAAGDPGLVVRLLGPVELTDTAGTTAKFERSKTLELLAWIVTHRDGPTRSGARTALWDLDVRDATFANVVSEARRVMARHVPPPEDDEWLRRTMTDELSLHDGVVADIDIVRAALVAARGRPADEAMELLRPAVELVRGMPFAGTSYLWPDVEGLSSNLVLLTTSVTAEYARLGLACGAIDGVFWATGKGLNVLAGQETLIALRMRAHAEHGDLSGVRVEWEAYERVLNADPWSDGEPTPKLVALRKELLSK